MNGLDLGAIEEAHIHVERVGTHYTDCHLQHRPCAIAALVAEVRALRAERDRLADGIREHRRKVRGWDVSGPRGPVHRGTPVQSVNERLWALLDAEEQTDE